MEKTVGSELIRVGGTCPYCHTSRTIPVNRLDWEEWKTGRKLIQAAFPDMSASDRELLLTGICDPCWDTHMAGEENEND